MKFLTWMLSLGLAAGVATAAEPVQPAPKSVSAVLGSSLEGQSCHAKYRKVVRKDGSVRYVRVAHSHHHHHRHYGRRRGNEKVRVRNVGLGVTGLGLITGSDFLTGVGLGGVIANEVRGR